MKKLVIAIVALCNISAFADINCGQTWSMNNRYYMDGKDGVSDIEVLIPAHSEENVKNHYKNKLTTGCLYGKLIKVGAKEVFVALDIRN